MEAGGPLRTASRGRGRGVPRGVGLGRLAGYPARAKEKLVKVLYGKPEIDQALRRMARQIGEAMPLGRTLP